jgi:sulfate adenylyltransferase
MDRILDERELCDLECLSIDAFAPLQSYMTKAQYESCLQTMTLDGVSVFPIPIVLSSPVEVNEGTVVTLKSITGVIFATLSVAECWQPNMDAEFVAVFGTNDDNHPYIKYMKSKAVDGIWYLSGNLTMVSDKFHSDYLEYRKTPKELKAGKWVGFQTRNPLHRSHIELIKNASSYAYSDPNVKLLLHPVEGVTQECDIPFPVRMKCYKEVLPYLDNASLSILPLSMRMAGPREAVWHAVIRRNYGCTHFIVGRDHAGPSYKKKTGESFYKPEAASTLAKSMETQIGITILASEEVVYCAGLDVYMPASVVGNVETLQISGTKFRDMLENGTPVPSWYSYPEVIETLQRYYQKPTGLCVYFMGLSGAGKSTLAQGLRQRFQDKEPHKEVTLLDADEIRTNLSKGLGFSKADRSTNVRRIGYVASEIVRHGGTVLVANIAPYDEDRQYNKTLISKYGRYMEVFIDTPIEECERRDVKGLYKKAREGIIKEFTGVSDPFEVPTGSALVLSGGTVEEQLSSVWARINN